MSNTEVFYKAKEEYENALKDMLIARVQDAGANILHYLTLTKFFNLVDKHFAEFEILLRLLNI